MLTKRDVEKIQSQMANELNASSRTVVVCALMLLLLFGLAWFGTMDMNEADVLAAIVAARAR